MLSDKIARTDLYETNFKIDLHSREDRKNYNIQLLSDEEIWYIDGLKKTRLVVNHPSKLVNHDHASAHRCRDSRSASYRRRRPLENA